MNNTRIGHILKEEGLINDQALDFCLSIQRNQSHERIGKLLKDYDFINDDQMVFALAKQAGWGVYHGSFEPAVHMVNALGIDFLVRHMIFPAQHDGGVVFVMAFNDDLSATDVIQSRHDGKAKFMLTGEARLQKAIDRISKPGEAQQMNFVNADDLLTWIDTCLIRAIHEGATDIHFEPSTKALEVRMRIDGILHFYQALRLDVQKKLVNIIFHKADVTISDFGRFHDARFSFNRSQAQVEVRVSHIPCVQGSSLVLRLLDKSRASIPLTQLGYPRQLWDKIEEMLVKPEGMVLIAGPTGCGKTTTLYAILNALKSIERKIVTIEDPVEIHHSLLTQVQANERREITFGNAVRAFLRHDPNIMLIGEIRDELTAKEAIRASMTGHKVFATIHANGEMDAFLRLHDLNIPYVYMASNISMVITQRLIRQLCPKCKNRMSITEAGLSLHALKYSEGVKFINQPAGCDSCHAGYKGRRVIANVLDCDDSVAALLLDNDVAGLKQYVTAQGTHCSMAAQAKHLISEGFTSPQEAVRVLG